MTPETISPEDLRQAVRDLDRKRALLSTINDFALKLLGLSSKGELLWYVAREVVGRLGFRDCVIYLIDPDRALLCQVAAIGVKNPGRDEIVNALEIPIGQGITGHVAATREPLIVDDLRQDDRYIRDVELARSEICVPLMIDGEAVGVIDCEDPRPAVFGDEHLETLTTIAAMTSARLKLINETQRAEDRAAELRRSEEKLRQAQKMEAVGQLTGGIAHDFNNLLAIIQGNAEVLQLGSANTERALQAILRASNRGAELTQRLLAFSRRQPLHPRSIDVTRLIRDLSGLADRTLGETIKTRIKVKPGLWHASADPGQVENALLNLMINARDAMPGGGTLTIQCANQQLTDADVARHPETLAGDYVVLTVADSGVGMTAEVREHAFEPFFTTKDVGQGSGLGLSMVYGFAKQSQGHVTIDSDEGRGTTVSLFLPRADRPLSPRTTDPVEDVPLGSGETILVIEDDADLRRLAARMLRDLGYRVLHASDAAAARKLFDEHDGIDLVLSDVVLPGGTNGPEFAEQAKRRHPDLRIVFMSGYPAESSTPGGRLGGDEILLNKPFRRGQLAQALRAALGRPCSRAPR